MNDINQIVVHQNGSERADEYNICPKDYAAGGSIEQALGAKANIAQQGNAGDLEDYSTLMGSYNTDTGKWWTRTGLNIWNYIQGKISSVLGLTKDSYGGQAASLHDPWNDARKMTVGYAGSSVTTDKALAPCVFTNKNPNGGALDTNEYRIKDMQWADFGTKLNSSAGVALKSEVESEAQARANADSDITKNFTEADAAIVNRFSPLETKMTAAQTDISNLKSRTQHHMGYCGIPTASQNETYVVPTWGENLPANLPSKLSGHINVTNADESGSDYKEVNVRVDIFTMTAIGTKKTLLAQFISPMVSLGGTCSMPINYAIPANTLLANKNGIGIGIFNTTVNKSSPLIQGGQLILEWDA